MSIGKQVVEWSGWACLAFGIIAAGCSGSSVSMPTLPTAGTLTAGATSAAQVLRAPVASGRPSYIVVFPFATSTAHPTLSPGIGAQPYRNWGGDDQGTQHAELVHEVAQNICVQVATSLANNGWNSACQPRGTPLIGNNALIVDGAFTDISEGNWFRRIVIGLGAGASSIDTQVGLYQYSRGTSTQLATFNTHATSGKMPGAAVTAPAAVVAGGAAAAVSLFTSLASGGVKTITSSMSYLAQQSATQIVFQTNDYFSQQGWNRRSPAS